MQLDRQLSESIFSYEYREEVRLAMCCQAVTIAKKVNDMICRGYPDRFNINDWLECKKKGLSYE